MNMMSHLTRFDSEMQEDEDDLEEVAAPNGDQQVSKLRYVSKPYCLLFDIENIFSQFLFFTGQEVSECGRPQRRSHGGDHR